MEYWGHKAEDGRVQILIEHLRGTSKLCSDFADEFSMSDYGRVLGLYHDIGKYSKGFQKRIKYGGPIVDHSSAGAQCLRSISMLSFCIAGHHAGLMNAGTRGDVDNGTLYARLKKQLVGELDYTSFRSEVDSFKDLPKSMLSNLKWDKLYSGAFMTRMLFSCLVDADFLDTEAFMNDNHLLRGEYDTLDKLYKRYIDYVSAFGDDKSSINIKRTQIREECIAAAKGSEGLYSLTVPTGGGKTIASLGFALEHAMSNKNKKRIIYVIPYTSIIEQTADVFRNIVGNNNVLEHHMNVDYDEDEVSDAERHLDNQRKKLATENWDAPIIVTTNVQFFESLYANKTSRCRKLHNIANSIVIFDEAQMLPNDFLLPCLRSVQELISNYHVTAVLCTATQPSLEKFFPENMQPKEICSDVLGLYKFFKRITYKKKEYNEIDKLLGSLNSYKQVLCIVNTRKLAQQIYDGLDGDGCYHLSTFMTPIHRRNTLKVIKERLQAGLQCKVVATSLIEAGVDVDFPIVYREMAGLDSIIQAGGRCNREGKLLVDRSITCVFKLDDDNFNNVPAYIRQAQEISSMAFRKYDDIADVAAIKFYFDKMHAVKGYSRNDNHISDTCNLDKNKILQLTKELKFSDIAKRFKLIDEATRTVIIPSDSQAEELLRKLQYGERNRSLLRRASQYAVNVYARQYEKLLGMGKIEALDEEINVLTDLSSYDTDKGLVINMEDGIGVFL